MKSTQKQRVVFLSSSLTVLLALTASCSFFSPQVQTAKIADAAELVSERHDVYVKADAGLSDAEKAQFLAQTAALGAILGLEEVPISRLEASGTPVFDRHDDYVRGDGTLSALERRVYLRSTSELRGLIRAK